MKLQSSEIRHRFLTFFQERNHQFLAPASVVPQNDPSLLYINSGMAPLKKFFEGSAVPPAPRLTNYQPCIRTNDIEDVGDRHHLTMFEMLGSWAIGDYYKETAIPLAWELLTQHFNLPKEKLFATVYAGDEQLGISSDTTSLEVWRQTGVPGDHIVALGEDNFWGPAGLSGPCGPCTEIFYDTGEKFGSEYRPGSIFDDKSRYIEIWNAGVFMELTKNEFGKFSPLPFKSVDTGSGLERMEMVLNGFESVYQTSALLPLIEFAQSQLHGTKLLQREFRILVDHLRTSTFILAAGVDLAAEGHGYIPRRLLRRCFTIIDRSEEKRFDFSTFVDKVVAINEGAYPHLINQRIRVITAIHDEKTRFAPTLAKAAKLLNKELKKHPSQIVSAEFLFSAKATHGVPLDIMKDHLQSSGLQADASGYERLMTEHVRKSKTGKEKGIEMAMG